MSQRDVLKAHIARQVEMLEQHGMGHGKALQLVKQQIQRVIHPPKPAEPDVLTAQATSYINRLHFGKVWFTGYRDIRRG